MPTMIKGITRFGVSAAALAFGTVLASAQSFNSFSGAQLFGVDVTNNGLAYTVSLESGAHFVQGSNTYDITQLFGFWALGASSTLNASGQDQQGWKWNIKTANGGGDIAGWTHDANNGRLNTPPGTPSSIVLTYDGLNQPAVQTYGFHLQWKTTDGTQTGYISGTPAPEPASFAVLGLGAVALIRRRKRA